MRRRTFLGWAACLVFAGSAAADDAPSTSAKGATTPVVQQAAFVSQPLKGRMKQEAQERLSGPGLASYRKAPHCASSALRR